MANQIALSWDVDVAGTTLGSAGAAARLQAVQLYQDDVTDPVLGQLFGLTVDSDVTSEPDATTARRVLTLNMNHTNTPTAPPPFPCHPRTSTPPELPYPLTENVELAGTFFLTNGLTAVPTSSTQVPALKAGDSIQFLSQEGVFYEVAIASVTPTSITLTAPFTGTTGSSRAFKQVAAPVTLAAFFSSSPSDTNFFGAGATAVTLTYNDSADNGPFSVTVNMNGIKPAQITLDPSSIDISEIINIAVASTGAFGNNIGQITLVELSDDIPPLPADPSTERLVELIDEAQLLIASHLAYIPPSYFALAQQGAIFVPTTPTNAQLATPLAQFVAPETAAPPPSPPLDPATVPAPTFLSDLFTQTIKIALAGARVTPRTISLV